MRIAAVQSDIAWHDPAASRAGLIRLLDAADLPAGSLAVLPELADVGFTVDLAAVTPSDAPAWAAAEAARRGIWIGMGYPRRGADGFGRNEFVIARPDGSVATPYAKVHPFSIGEETKAYRGGDRLVLVRCGAFTVCPLVCYDLRFPELWRLAAAAGADLFVLGASWPKARQHHWRALSIARAIENQAIVVSVNRVGRDPSLEYGGGSLIVGAAGEVLAEAGSVATVITADVEHADVAAWRTRFPALRDLRSDLLGSIPVDRG
jgi:predicted amidohydrolase